MIYNLIREAVEIGAVWHPDPEKHFIDLLRCIHEAYQINIRSMCDDFIDQAREIIQFTTKKHIHKQKIIERYPYYKSMM